MIDEYPYYRVTAQKWNEEKEEYFYHTILETKDKDEAMEVFKQTEMTSDFIHIELFEEWENETIRLGYKDLMNDGTVDYVYGE